MRTVHPSEIPQIWNADIRGAVFPCRLHIRKPQLEKSNNKELISMTAKSARLDKLNIQFNLDKRKSEIVDEEHDGKVT